MNSKSTNNESPAALSFARDDIVLHKKTQHTYRVLGRCIIEATLADCYMYRGSDGRTWIRPAAEMEDGRFVLIESTAPGASESRGSVPDGFVLVPREATEAMCDAGNEGAAPYMVDAKLLWSQMLAAAPTPPAVSNGEPTSGHWMMAFAEQYDRIGDADCTTDFNDLERRARELARSAAAKGEG
ncbi:hypothetical protein FHW12_000293 [Dokdonella fugitiva]|uniref:DUF1653 domain-containing protein n=1 Tax=Dokdonella fugitiva TaxID=328517 RepID=A0A839EWF0_9GAMM|nr:hypothetical protein [Dokdonella fugitiva]MBA8886102.1 hypothetical protein [Dokdonella fugitiva]